MSAELPTQPPAPPPSALPARRLLVTLASAVILLIVLTVAQLAVLGRGTVASRTTERLTASIERLDRFSLALARLESFTQTFAESGDPRQASRMTEQHRLATDDIAFVAAESASVPADQLAAVAIGSRLIRLLTLQERIIRERNQPGDPKSWDLFLRESQPLLAELNGSTARLGRLLHDRRAELASSVRAGRAWDLGLAIACAGCGVVLSGVAFVLRHRIVAPPPDSKSLRKEISRLKESACELQTSLNAATAHATALREMLAQTSAFVWAVDRGGVYVLSEGRAEPVNGTQPGEAIGRREADVMKETPAFAEFTERALRGETFTSELTHRGRWYEVRYHPLRDDRQETTGAVGLALDVTERRAMEQSARTAESAREANRLHSEFLASMGHEVRTPMNGILGMSGMLQQTALSEEQRGMLDVIEHSVGDLLSAINNVLDLSRLESGKLTLAALPIDLRLLVENTLAAHGRSARTKGLELINDFAPALADQVIGDESRLRQVLENLLSNAIKFTSRGQVVVRVQRKPGTSASMVNLRIEFVDSGAGLSPEAQEKLLQPFDAADAGAAVTRKFGGTGFGLAIAKQLVELMGGRLGVTSEVGIGSTFWIEVALPNAGPGAHPDLPADFLAESSLLLVDDNEVSRGIIALQLSARGAKVDPVDSGTAALKRCLAQAGEGKPYDVVIVDRYMPAPDGLRFIRSLRAAPGIGMTPVVLLSPDDDPAADIPPELVYAAIAKPIRQTRLLQAVHEARTASVQTHPARPTAPPFALSSAAHLHVLVVEDNAVNQKVASVMLKRLGHTCEIAEHGAEALEKLATSRYDAVLMDCHMPVMDGYEAAARIRASGQPWSKIRLIAVTANSTTADRQRCEESGFDDFVAKPITVQAIQAALAKCPSADARSAPAPAATPNPLAAPASDRVSVATA